MERPLPEGVDPTRIEQYLHDDEFTVRPKAIMHHRCGLYYDQNFILTGCVVSLPWDSERNAL